MNRLFNSLKAVKGLDRLPKEAMDTINQKIRDKAIERTEHDMIHSIKPIDDYTEDEISKLVAKAEKDIRNELKSGGLKTALAVLGIGYFI